MAALHVAIIYGGKSTEHEVSIRSARNIAKAIDKTKYCLSLIGIGKNGAWYAKTSEQLQTEDMVLPNTSRLCLVPGGSQGRLINLETNTEWSKLDAIFPIVHGAGGEDGSLQGILKTMNIPFVGPGVVGSVLCIDKVIAKRMLNEAGIRNSLFLAYDKSDKHEISYEKAVKELGLPMFVKPPNLGSSVGVNKVHDKKEFEAAIDEAFQYDQKVLIEQNIVGREIECAVLGNAKVQASPLGEVVTNSDNHSFYSYKAKYTDVVGSVTMIPAALDKNTENRIQAIAIQTYKVLNCEGMSRVDVFVTDAGEIIVNEVNTLPGFTDISMYPKLWEAGGIAYADLIEKLFTFAIERFDEENTMQTSVNTL